MMKDSVKDGVKDGMKDRMKNRADDVWWCYRGVSDRPSPLPLPAPALALVLTEYALTLVDHVHHPLSVR